jgi:hypothetical protein
MVGLYACVPGIDTSKILEP